MKILLPLLVFVLLLAGCSLREDDDENDPSDRRPLYGPSDADFFRETQFDEHE